MVFAPMYENDMIHGTFVLNVLLEAICDVAYGYDANECSLEMMNYDEYIKWWECEAWH